MPRALFINRRCEQGVVAIQRTEMLGKALGCAATTAFLLLLALFLVRYFGEALGFLGREPRAGMGGTPRRPWRTVCVILAAFVLSRHLCFLSALVYVCLTGDAAYYLENLPAVWVRWDAYHYIKLAEQWYVNVGDDRIKIV